MEMMAEQIAPITVPEGIQALKEGITEIMRKNRTMIDYYIYPRQTPSEISAYQPRLQILYGRIESLERLDMTKLPLIIDDAAALVSTYLLPVVDQLLNAIHGIQTLFINHYDRDLDNKRPYEAIYKQLEYREKQLKQFQEQQMRNPQRRPAEALNSTPNAASPAFCKYAIAFVNRRDMGKLSQVLSEDLRKEHRQRLTTSGGAYLWWVCPGCAFKLRYHITSSGTSNIHNTDETVTDPEVPDIEYRAAWLVKCHLYQAKSEGIDDDPLSPLTRSTTSNSNKRQGMQRRQTEYRSDRRPNVWINAPRRSLGENNFSNARRRNSESQTINRHQYGCPFCFANGRPHRGNTFSSGKDLAEHIELQHNANRPPSGLLMEKYMVGLNGKAPERVPRWDLNIK